mmetsp:Transcript_56895/g.107205  ORF Transcript_56895/g.107205 Transcript_56895/m.107205 type:complete len:261 (-) Transcript_56895:3598-4380(-)
MRSCSHALSMRFPSFSAAMSSPRGRTESRARRIRQPPKAAAILCTSATVPARELSMASWLCSRSSIAFNKLTTASVPSSDAAACSRRRDEATCGASKCAFAPTTAEGTRARKNKAINDFKSVGSMGDASSAEIPNVSSAASGSIADSRGLQSSAARKSSCSLASLGPGDAARDTPEGEPGLLFDAARKGPDGEPGVLLEIIAESFLSRYLSTAASMTRIASRRAPLHTLADTTKSTKVCRPRRVIKISTNLLSFLALSSA